MLLSELAQALSAAKVPYCIVGGVAVNLHGASRETYNLDIVVPTEKRSLDALGAVFQKLGFRCKQRIELEELADRRTRRTLVERQNLVALTFARSDLEVELVVAPPIEASLLIKRSVKRDVGGVDVRVAALPDLICMKRVSGRLLDAGDVARLERARRR